ncbi:MULTISPECIES: hypothetical protein [Priestia]|uniref:hypothetical protein n=1 Tax=Priestia TaxID=2800373 RepID=UPI00159B92FA|nr:hypothetical protein [Priestia aryabhattai]
MSELNKELSNRLFLFLLLYLLVTDIPKLGIYEDKKKKAKDRYNQGDNKNKE